MHTTNRRDFVKSMATLSLAAVAWPARGEAKKATRLVILGTKGGPRVAEEGRRNTSVVLLINGVPYVVDCGYGASRQLLAAGIPLESVRYVFLTHHHSDHTLEYGPLFYNAWVTGSSSRVDAYGPPGTVRMTQSFFAYMKDDIDVRIVDEGRPDLRTQVFAHDIDKAGVVFANDDVKVTAALVQHPPIKHSYAFRFDAADRSIVISGDTAYSQSLIDLAKGADVLVHEVMDRDGIEGLLKRVPNAARLREHLLVSHTFAEDVGKVAAAAGVKTVVLYHFVPGDVPISDEQWAAGVRQHFKGRIIVGKDLMEIE